MDELEERRRIKRFQQDPIGELRRDLEQHLRDLTGLLTQARQRRITFWTWYAGLPLVDLALFPLVSVWHWALGWRLDGNVLVTGACMLAAFRLGLRAILTVRAGRQRQR